MAKGRAGDLFDRIGMKTIVLSALSIVVGAVLGLAVYTFVFAKGYAYFTTDPRNCINCHVMNNEYKAWQGGSHKAVATCDDCHLPHDNLVHKYTVQAEDGFLHGLKFSTGWYPENIKIRAVNAKVAQGNCLRCHAPMVSELNYTRSHNTQVDCLHCHSDVGHRK